MWQHERSDSSGFESGQAVLGGGVFVPGLSNILYCYESRTSTSGSRLSAEGNQLVERQLSEDLPALSVSIRTQVIPSCNAGYYNLHGRRTYPRIV
ncbi:hypothetical protein ASPCAL11514 [Aspergillus calidoustus]|uniref:Uncharacterized protein n=1 Tax=Aspergillus calidoustus TaxID=454130 RepID=A0A0U5CEJ3_ASPCI|nr:hypothetical protein ASPCAL11514 [Aspergillus calidoustus]